MTRNVGRPPFLKKPVRTAIRLDAAMMDALAAEADELGATMSGLMRKIFQKHIDGKTDGAHTDGTKKPYLENWRDSK